VKLPVFVNHDDIIESTKHDEWRLLGYGMLTAVLMALALVPILTQQELPEVRRRRHSEAIALAVFALAKYMARPRKPN
jgi:hypothetical protein